MSRLAWGRLLAVAALVAAAVVPVRSIASPVTILDTFTHPDRRGGVGVQANHFSGVEYGVPFSVPSAGRITRIDTGFAFRAEIDCGFRIGVIPYAALLGSTTQPGFDHLMWTDYRDVYTHESESFTCLPPVPSKAVQVGAFERVSLDGLSWDVSPGDYALVIAFRSDFEHGIWTTNLDMPSDDLLIQVIGGGLGGAPNPCGGVGGDAPWVTLAACGLQPIGTPEARITLEVPEPPTGGLFLLALAAATVPGARRLTVLQRE